MSGIHFMQDFDNIESACHYANTVILPFGECAAAICTAESIFMQEYTAISQYVNPQITQFRHTHFDPEFNCVTGSATTEVATTGTAEASTEALTTEEPTQIGFLCDSDSTCSDGGVCKGNCCSQWMNDENCESCNDQGWCAECVPGWVYNLETSICDP